MIAGPCGQQLIEILVFNMVERLASFNLLSLVWYCHIFL